jgi:hypothetical protein
LGENSIGGNIMTEERLKEIDARAAAATPGPWELVDAHDDYVRPEYYVVMKREAEHGFWDMDTSLMTRPEEPDFIAHAREDIPDLVAALREAWLEVRVLRDEADRLYRWSHGVSPDPPQNDPTTR